MTGDRTESIDKRRLALGALMTLIGIGVALLVGVGYHNSVRASDPDEFFGAALGILVALLSGLPAGFFAVRRSFSSERQVGYAVLINSLMVALLLVGLVVGGEGGVEELTGLVLLCLPYVGTTTGGALFARNRDLRDTYERSKSPAKKRQ